MADKLTIKHDWTVDGWDKFSRATITAHGTQGLTQSVSSGRGVLSPTAAAQGNYREAFLLGDTKFKDAEMTSLVWPKFGATAAQNGPQQGHIHRVRQRRDGWFEGIAIWTAIIGGGFDTLNWRGVRWDGNEGTLKQSTGDDGAGSDRSYIDRTIQVATATRVVFGGSFEQYKVIDRGMSLGLEVGDVVTTAGMTDSSFNHVDCTITSTDGSGLIQIADPLEGGAVATHSTLGGTIVPSGVHAQGKWTPHWMSTRVVGGDNASCTVQVKRWRYEDAEPPWSDARVMTKTIAANANVPELAAEPGHCALWAAHASTTDAGEQMRWGEITVRQL